MLDEWAPEHFLQEGIPWTPLHLAAWNGHGRVATLLLRGAEPIRLGQELRRVPRWRPGSLNATAGATPLHLAALRGHSEASASFEVSKSLKSVFSPFFPFLYSSFLDLFGSF